VKFKLGDIVVSKHGNLVKIVGAFPVDAANDIPSYSLEYLATGRINGMVDALWVDTQYEHVANGVSIFMETL
jgi:hypothetical protein